MGRTIPGLPAVDALTERDSQHIWHPYTQVALEAPVIPIVRAQGALLYDSRGDAHIDAISSWWVTLHGHCHPHLMTRIREQLDILDHVMFAGFTHQGAVELAGRLLSLVSPHLTRVFYTDNGSTAVEVALKIACQYWYNRTAQRPRTRIIAFHGAHHGETFGAMSVSDRSRFIRPFEPFLFDVDFIEPPVEGRQELSLEQMKNSLRQNDVACFIYEPCLQGSAGMVPHDPRALESLIGLCRDAEVVTIADEVLTGFGRLGPLFASNDLAYPPDMICLAKGLTGGVLPMGVTLCAEQLYEAFYSPDRSKALLHGHAYCANPIGCAAALASLELLETDACDQKRSAIEARHRNFQSRYSEHPALKRCDVMGTVLSLEYSSGESSYFSESRDRLMTHFRERRVQLRPFGNSVHVLPPYCISAEQLDAVYDAIISSLEIFQ